MKLAFSKPTRSREAQQLLFDSYPKYGFDGLQLKGNQYGDYVADGPAGAERFKQEWGADLGHVSSMITMNPLDEEGTGRLRALVSFASAAGAERVVICHDVPREGLSDADIAGFAVTLSGLADEAADQGVRLSLHHHTNQPVMHRGDFDTFFAAVKGENLGLTLDTGHVLKSGITDIPELIGSFSQVIDNVHLKDYSGGEFRLLGQGDVDLVSVLGALGKLNGGATLCVDEESRAEIEEGLTVSRDYLKEHAPQLSS